MTNMVSRRLTSTLMLLTTIIITGLNLYLLYTMPSPSVCPYTGALRPQQQHNEILLWRYEPCARRPPSPPQSAPSSWTCSILPPDCHPAATMTQSRSRARSDGACKTSGCPSLCW